MLYVQERVEICPCARHGYLGNARRVVCERMCARYTRSRVIQRSSSSSSSLTYSRGNSSSSSGNGSIGKNIFFKKKTMESFRVINSGTTLCYMIELLWQLSFLTLFFGWFRESHLKSLSSLPLWTSSTHSIEASPTEMTRIGALVQPTCVMHLLVRGVSRKARANKQYTRVRIMFEILSSIAFSSRVRHQKVQSSLNHSQAWRSRRRPTVCGPSFYYSASGRFQSITEDRLSMRYYTVQLGRQLLLLQVERYAELTITPVDRLGRSLLTASVRYGCTRGTGEEESKISRFARTPAHAKAGTSSPRPR
ncbi:unnamed protein product [Trichogramma brassicae]|uniref:Uncharacterized protein n=1 Tax=Trichogramma brassicae TaxID=86971 RepID=A0A6H5IVI6_9HYME|nr:unnamed protein product [Trichogramma brassicae]